MLINAHTNTVEAGEGFHLSAEQVIGYCDRQYYVAWLKGTTVSPSSCLRDHGFSEDRVKRLIETASIARRPYIFTPFGDSKMLLLIHKSKDGWQYWWTRADNFSESRMEAEELVQLINELPSSSCDGKKWAVFEWSALTGLSGPSMTALLEGEAWS